MSVRIIHGDVMAALAQLEPDSVDCVVTSPPYWRLRAYLPEGHPDKRLEIGMEPTLAEHIARLVAVFEGVKRVLKPTGTVWLNYGDMYAGKGDARPPAQEDFHPVNGHPYPEGRRGGGLKPKDLCMAANRLAIALQDAGWWVRSEIVWEKANPLPESVTDRPTTSHEKVWLLTKAARYYYDAQAVRQPSSDNTHGRVSKNGYRVPNGKVKSPHGRGFEREDMDGRRERAKGRRGTDPRHDDLVTNHQGLDRAFGVTPKSAEPGIGIKANDSFQAAISGEILPTRNLRTVWRIATQPWPEAHFATFPESLAEICIKAGSSEHGCCPSCGAPWRRLSRQEQADGRASGNKARNRGEHARAGVDVGRGFPYQPTAARTVGWAPGCDCPVRHPLRPALVLDPFGGSGTVGLVADRLGRDAVLIELVGEYANDMARRRVSGDAPLFDALGERAR